MYKYLYDYLKYGNNVKLCYMDMDSLLLQAKSEEVYADLAENVEKRFNSPKYEVNNIVLPIAKNKKVIHLMKDELKGRYQNMLLY